MYSLINLRIGIIREKKENVDQIKNIDLLRKKIPNLKIFMTIVTYKCMILIEKIYNFKV